MDLRTFGVRIVGAASALALSACVAVAPAAPAATEASSSAAAEAGPLVVYSGRSENLVSPLIEKFKESTGLNVEVRYGSTAEMAATILEEGDNSPADVFFSQDAGALGALDEEGRLSPLPQATLDQAPPQFRSQDGDWVGVSGRARVLVYNTDTVPESELPADVFELTDPKWKGRVAWAPTNASFQSFITAMRILDGEDAARQWLLDMIANDVQAYENNNAIVAAVGAGEIDLGLVNHYYLHRFLKEQGDQFPARNYHFTTPGAGSIINVAGAGILNSAKHREAAELFVNYLLSPEAQTYFADETMEYPLAGGVPLNPALEPLDQIAAPDLDLSQLEDLQTTLQLLQETGAVQ